MASAYAMPCFISLCSTTVDVASDVAPVNYPDDQVSALINALEGGRLQGIAHAGDGSIAGGRMSKGT